MRRFGYVRPSRGFPASRQVKALTDAGVHDADTYIEGRDGETLEELLRCLEPGDTIELPSADRLTNRSSLIAPLLDDIHERGAVVVDVSTGLRSQPDGYRFMGDAIEGLRRDRPRLTSAKAREMRAKGGRPATPLLVPQSEARRLFKDKTLPLDEVERLTGWDRSKLYKAFPGGRGVKAGRPRKARR